LIFVDNATPQELRVFLDGTEWFTIGTGESKKKTLGRGVYELTVKAVGADFVWDRHSVEVTSTGPYVLNLMGAQVYFHGTVEYGELVPAPSMETIDNKWFVLPKADCVFRDPPKRISFRGRDTDHRKFTLTFLTKGSPPHFNGPVEEH
jgi:hypothetical protein